MRLALTALALSCCAAPGIDPRTISSAWPPSRFSRDTTVRVRFVMTQAEIDRACGKADSKHIRGGCVRPTPFGPIITMPHPAVLDPPEFRLIAAHELAHVNGWPETHGE